MEYLWVEFHEDRLLVIDDAPTWWRTNEKVPIDAGPHKRLAGHAGGFHAAADLRRGDRNERRLPAEDQIHEKLCRHGIALEYRAGTCTRQAAKAIG